MKSISETLSGFARDISYDAIPPHVRERAKHLILDAVGIAHAATRYDFAPRALAGIEAFGDVLAREGLEPAGTSADVFGVYIKAEIQKWHRVIARAGVKAD